MKAWVPAERKRVAGLIVQMRAHAQQQLAQLRAQTAELVKLERDQLGKRIRDARAAARLGKCVDLTAGPALHVFGPKRPPKGFRPPPRGSRAANADAYDQRSRELVSEALAAQRSAKAHAQQVARGMAYNPKHPDRPLRRPVSKKAGVRARKPKGKVRSSSSRVGKIDPAYTHVGRHAYDSTIPPPPAASKLTRRQLLAAAKRAGHFGTLSSFKPSAADLTKSRRASSRSLPPASDLALARQEREVRMYEAELKRARRSSAPPPSKSKKRKSTPPKLSTAAAMRRHMLAQLAFNTWAARMVAPRERGEAWDKLPAYAQEWWAKLADAKPRDARAAFAAYNSASGNQDQWADIAPHARAQYGLVADALTNASKRLRKKR